MLRRALLAAAGFLVACTAFGRAADEPDAGPDAGPDSGRDSGGPPLAMDAATDMDAAVLDASQPFTCAAHAGATSCLDFENTLAPFPGWNAFNSGSGDAVEVVAQGLSSPNALFANMGDVGASASRIRRVIPSATSLRLSFAVRLGAETIGTDSQITLAELLCRNNGIITSGVLVNVTANHAIGLALLPAAAPFGVGPGTIVPDRWTSMVFDLDGNTQASMLSVDGVVANPVITVSCAYELELQLGLGTAFNQPATAFYDDVVLELTP